MNKLVKQLHHIPKPVNVITAVVTGAKIDIDPFPIQDYSSC